MIEGHEVELLDRWFEEGPSEVADRVIDAALDRVRSTPQHGAPRRWWRSSGLPGRARLAVGWAVVALAVAVAASGLVLRPQRVVEVGTSPSPAPSSTGRPSHTGIDTSAWLPFTSDRHGYALRYPPDWVARAATRSWLYGASNDVDVPGSAAVDQFDAGRISLLVASLALPAGVTELDWRAADPTSVPCDPPRTDWQPITVAGIQGGLHGGQVDCDTTEAAVVAGGRVYQFTAYADRDAEPTMILSRSLFDALLSTVRLDPSSADDALPSGVRANAIPVPALTQGFSSPLHDYSLLLPADWTVTAATRAWSADDQTPSDRTSLDDLAGADARLAVRSQPLAASQTPGSWMSDFARRNPPCGTADGMPLATVDGLVALIDVDGCAATDGIVPDGRRYDLVVVSGARAYDFTLDGRVDADYFRALLATVTLGS